MAPNSLLTIHSDVLEHAQIMLYSDKGKLIWNKDLMIEPGENRMTINSDVLANGVYTIIIQSGDRNYALKWVVAH